MKAKDDDKAVWEGIYIPSYKSKIIGTHFDIENYYYSKNRKRLVAHDKENSDIEISGETDFNFGLKEGLHRLSRYEKYKKILESIYDQKKRKSALRLLDYCKQGTYEMENYSLMLCNGSLQMVKGSLDMMDRVDVFLYLLDSYYKKKDELILSQCSFKSLDVLKNYLNLFLCEDNRKESIYIYCYQIYHITNRKLIDDMVKSGRLSIQSPDRVIDYMKLAVRFWNAKSCYYQKNSIPHTRKLKLVLDL